MCYKTVHRAYVCDIRKFETLLFCVNKRKFSFYDGLMFVRVYSGEQLVSNLQAPSRTFFGQGCDLESGGSRLESSGVFSHWAMAPLWPLIDRKKFFTIRKNRKTWFSPPICVSTDLASENFAPL